LHLALFLIVSIYWGCSAPLTKLLGVPEHLQPPPSYAYEREEKCGAYCESKPFPLDVAEVTK